MTPTLGAADVAALAARVVRAESSVGAVRLVCVDGPAGSGKTSLASALAGSLLPLVGRVPVVHGDEVYEGWPVVAEAHDRLDAFGRLAERLSAWLLDPWASGSAGAHPVWDWTAGAWGEPHPVPAAPVVVLEGVGLAARALRERAVLSVWVEADEATRLDRVLARDGDALRSPMLAWQADEQRWFIHDRTRAGCAVRLRT